MKKYELIKKKSESKDVQDYEYEDQKQELSKRPSFSRRKVEDNSWRFEEHDLSGDFFFFLSFSFCFYFILFYLFFVD